MKQIFTFFTVMVFAMTLHAQYIYNDFDQNQNEEFNSWPNPLEIITNPDMSGINTSPAVAKCIRSTEQYANIYCVLPGKVDFSTGTTFQVKVHSPITCTVRLKLEDQNDGGVFVELDDEVEETNTWVQLSFNFTDGESDKYDKIVIFLDFASTNDNIFYFDDVTGPEYEDSGQQVDLPVTFDDENVNYILADFGGNASQVVVDPTNSTNNVAESIKTEGAETWAGTTIGGNNGFANPVPFTEDLTTMSVRVWSPTANTPIRLKVEDAGDPGISVETETMTTMAETWETLFFDFSNEVEGTAPLNLDNTYDKCSIFFNFGTNGGGETYYWDDVYFVDPTGIYNREVKTISVFPNPATDVLNIANAQDLETISIYSVTGQLVFTSQEQPEKISLENYQSGMYLIRGKSIDGSVYQANFIVK
jgi:hypothetical protein